MRPSGAASVISVDVWARAEAERRNDESRTTATVIRKRIDMRRGTKIRGRGLDI
jgi:hypothetical protein